MLEISCYKCTEDNNSLKTHFIISFEYNVEVKVSTYVSYKFIEYCMSNNKHPRKFLCLTINAEKNI